MSESFSSLEEKILDRIQADFPLSPDPYGDIGREVGCGREEAHDTVVELRRRGIIRRIGGVFAAGKLGYESCLVAARVNTSRIEEVASKIGAYPEVTHNYEREGPYNLWFTIVAENSARMDQILNSTRESEGVEAAHALPALKTFKIQVDFEFGGKNDS